MSAAGKGEEFDALWRDSIARAGQIPDWNEMSFGEQKWISSQFRREMARYGAEDPTGKLRRSGLYGSQPNSRIPGSTPGREPEEEAPA